MQSSESSDSRPLGRSEREAYTNWGAEAGALEGGSEQVLGVWTSRSGPIPYGRVFGPILWPCSQRLGALGRIKNSRSVTTQGPSTGLPTGMGGSPPNPLPLMEGPSFFPPGTHPRSQSPLHLSCCLPRREKG